MSLFEVKEKWWYSSLKMTIIVQINKNGSILYTAPISHKFVGEHIDRLRSWMRKQGKFKRYKL